MIRKFLVSLIACVAPGIPGASGAPLVMDSVLIIGQEVTAIHDREFADRSDFHSIRFEGTPALREIGEYAFIGCTNLRELDLPDCVRKIGEGAFRECSSLKNVKWPQGAATMPRYAFSWCDALESITLPSTLTDIGSHAFIYCYNLRHIKLPPRLRHIGSNAFSLCRSLESIEIPPILNELESYAFSDCTSLRSAILPANRNMLGELIFSGCRNLESITMSSPIPPAFDCNSTLFEPAERYMYERCVLLVPPRAVETYRKAPGFDLFKDVRAFSRPGRPSVR